MSARQCPYCKTKTSNSKNSTLCEPVCRISKFWIFGKCKIDGKHYHNICPACGKSWVKSISDPNPIFNQWEANVIDAYKGLSVETIKQQNIEKSFPYAVLLNNFSGDFNISSAMRNANAFGAREVFYIGNRKYNRLRCVGVHKYMDIKYISMNELIDLKKRYTFVGVDNIPGAKEINDYVYPRASMLIFGEECSGITTKILELCDDLIYIKQFGSIRSINCAAASAVVMNDYVSKYNKGAL